MAITLRRALVSSLGPRSILSEALDHMRHIWEVDSSLEQNLARVIAIDKEDFASLNKLRLLRMCKVLCKSSAPLDMAVGIVSTTPIDDIMYGLFGFDRVRVSILDLMRPRTSIITMAQSRVYDLLEAWAPDETNLRFPPGTVGASFEDAGIRMRARAQVLQMSAVILDGFELMMSNPHIRWWS